MLWICIVCFLCLLFNCVRADMNDDDDDDVGIDLQLDEMEMVAVAAGYHYYKSVIAATPERGRGLGTDNGFLFDALDGPDDVWREMFRMDKHVFHKLSDLLREKSMLRDTAGVMIEEQLGIFLNIIGHNERNRVVQERFCHSGETISRYFNIVLKAIKSLSLEFLPSPPLATHSQILTSQRFFPYFQDCIGVVDTTHIPANVPAKDQSRFRDCNRIVSHNVLAACTLDLDFVFVYPGWEGSAPDWRVLKAVLDDPNQNFPEIPQGKYYLVDGGFSNMEGFMGPYEGARCEVEEFRGANQMPRNAKELFNQRHSYLRIAMRRCFNVLKSRFPILKVAPQYAFQVQRDVVIAACVLHNYVRRHQPNDWLFSKTDNEEPEIHHQQVQPPPQQQQQHAFSHRDSIASAMWDNFFNNWDDW